MRNHRPTVLDQQPPVLDSNFKLILKETSVALLMRRHVEKWTLIGQSHYVSINLTVQTLISPCKHYWIISLCKHQSALIQTKMAKKPPGGITWDKVVCVACCCWLALGSSAHGNNDGISAVKFWKTMEAFPYQRHQIVWYIDLLCSLSKSIWRGSLDFLVWYRSGKPEAWRN